MTPREHWLSLDCPRCTHPNAHRCTEERTGFERSEPCQCRCHEQALTEPYPTPTKAIP